MPRYQLKVGYGPDYWYDPRTGERKQIAVGDTIKRSVHEMKGRRDKYECLDPEQEAEGTPFPGPNTGLRVVARKQGSGWFDVVNPATGMPINDRALHFDEASTMANDPANIPGADEPVEAEDAEPDGK